MCRCAHNQAAVAVGTDIYFVGGAGEGHLLDDVFALRDRCPHKGGALSQGLVAGKTVTCPLHGWKIQFENGEAVAPDTGCAKHYPSKVESGAVWIAL